MTESMNSFHPFNSLSFTFIPNTIFLDPEDTKDLVPKLYKYQLSYEPDHYRFEEHPEMLEVNTMITGLFEVIDKF